MAAQKETRIVELVINGKQAELSLNQLKGKVIQLTKELSRMKEADDPKLYQQKAAELRKVNEAYKEMRAGITGATTATQRFWSGMKQIAGGVLAGNIITGMVEKLASIIPEAIKSNAELSDSFSDVKKTTGLTTKEVEELNKELKQLNTRTSRKELLQLASDAGKLGITGKENVLGFVKAANQIKVALGEDLGEDAIKNIGKLVDIFKLTDEFGLEKAMLKIGSTINGLGMASTASEGYMVEFLKRMGGIAPLAKITAPEMLALGGTLDSLGQTSEVSSTALGKLFIKMASDAQTYSKMAGVSVQEFTDLVNNNAMEAFIKVLEGAGKKDGGIIELTQTLGDLGIEGGRATGVFGTLANNTEKLRAQMALGNELFKEGTSITAEYNEKNTNLAANLEKIAKWMGAAYNNSALKAGIENTVSGIAKLLGFTTSEVDALAKQQGEIQLLVERITELNEGNTDRVELLDQLIKTYPDYFAHLDKDKTSNIELMDAMKKTNEELVKKIAYHKELEEIAQAEKKIEDRRANAGEFELRFRKELNAIAKRNNIDLKLGVSLLEKAKFLLEDLPSTPQASSEKNILGNYIITYERVIGSIDEMTQKAEEAKAAADALFNDIAPSKNTGGQKIVETEEEKKARLARELAEFKAAEAAKAAATEDAIKARIAAQKEFAKNTETLLKDLDQLRAEGIKEEERREIALLHNKYQWRLKEIREIKASDKVKNDILLAEKEGFEREVGVIEYKYSKKRADDEYEQGVTFLKLYYDKRKADLDKSYLDGTISTEQYNQELLDLEFEMLEAKLVLNRDYGKSVVDIEQDISDKKVNIKNEELAAHQRTIDELERMSDEFDKNERARADEAQKREEEKRAYQIRVAESAFDVISALRQHKTTTELQAIDAESYAFEKKQDKEKASLKQQLASELITQEKYDAAMTALEEEATAKQKELRKKQFYIEQESALAMARINLVKMVSQALVTPPGPPATIPFGIAAAIMGGLQIAQIKNTPVPNFYGGGVTVTGAMDGRQYNASTTGSFARGGAVNSATVGLIGERGPELVIPNWLYTAPQSANVMRALEAAIYSKQAVTPQFAEGGKTSFFKNSPFYTSIPGVGSLTRDYLLGNAINEIRETLNLLNERLSTPIEAKTLYNKQEYDDYVKDDSNARRAGKF